VIADWRTNPGADPQRPYGKAERAILDPDDCAAARAEIASWPGYAATPLVDLPGLAASLGVERLAIKDEGGRFGLGSFKALGGAYAVFRHLRARVVEVTSEIPTTDDLVAGRYAGIARGMTVCCATDGNHGRFQ
jgi:diaminopropionate ammonia-lyase